MKARLPHGNAPAEFDGVTWRSAKLDLPWCNRHVQHAYLCPWRQGDCKLMTYKTALTHARREFYARTGA